MKTYQIARATTTIDAPRSSVWNALITPSSIKQYLFGADISSEQRQEYFRDDVYPVTIELTDIGARTRITLVQPTEFSRELWEEKWQTMLATLKDFVERQSSAAFHFAGAFV